MRRYSGSCGLIWILTLALCLPVLLFSQGQPGDFSVECVVCHISFHPAKPAATSLIPKVQTPIQIQGKAAHIAREVMCYTCHDGTIMDSRESFASENHRAFMDPKHVQVQGLPLDRNKQVYCGTCHSPHSLTPNRRGGFAPFLRAQATDSKLCTQCHAAQGTDHVNHPIHVPAPGMSSRARGILGDVTQVECMTCHPIHGDKDVLLVNGEDRTELCSACHADRVGQVALTDHDLTTPSRRIGPPARDVCSSCHASHNGSGKTMWAQPISDPDYANAYCVDCHSESGSGSSKAFTHTGHPYEDLTMSDDIPALGLKADDEISCTSCHDPHQWEFGRKHQVTSANEEGTEYTSFLKLPDDAQGQLCISCHGDQATMMVSDHSVSREGFQQHFRQTDAIRGQCSVCHTTHEEGFQNASPEAEDPFAGLCLSCHNDENYPTSVVHQNHPLGVAFNSQQGLHGRFTPDGPLLSCNTCHDPHSWGESLNASTTADLDGNDRNSFLTVKNWPEPGLCLDCHPDQEAVLGTDHDLSNPAMSACSFCHAPHNAASEYGMLARWGEAQGESFNEKHCFSCHQEGGLAEAKIVKAYTHPREYGTLAAPARGLGDWLKFPLFSDDGPTETVGHIDCFTCHNPHQWSHREDLKTPGELNEEGNDLTSFLRNPSHQTLCTDCHGPGTLWKYNYYHDPNKRKRY